MTLPKPDREAGKHPAPLVVEVDNPSRSIWRVWLRCDQQSFQIGDNDDTHEMALHRASMLRSALKRARTYWQRARQQKRKGRKGK